MSGMLDGVRVLDLTQVVSGPFGTLLLGDLGAEVIKIESPSGDTSRGMPTPKWAVEGESVYFCALNRNKRSIVLDLKDEEDRRVLLDLVKVSDVVVDNYRPGVLERLGVDHSALSAVNPRIVACSITGFGSTGPRAEQPAFDLMIQARYGGMHVTGTPGGEPVRMGVSISDHAAGMFAALAICAALHARDRTGQGRRIEVPLASAMVSLLSYMGATTLATGENPGPQGSQHATGVPYGAVRAKDQWFVVDSHLQQFWAKFGPAIGRPELAEDARFKTREARNRNRADLYRLLDEHFATKTAAEWLATLEEAGIPCAPINTLSEALADPQTLHNRMVVEIEHAGAAVFKAVGNPILDAADPEPRYASPPPLGADAEPILRELLAYEDERVGAYFARRTKMK